MGPANGTEAEARARKQAPWSQGKRGSGGGEAGRAGRAVLPAGETCVVMRHHVHSVGGTVEGPEWGDRASMSTAVAPAVTGRWMGREGRPGGSGQGEACAWRGSRPHPLLAQGLWL